MPTDFLLLEFFTNLLSWYFVVQTVLCAVAVLFYVFPRNKRNSDLEINHHG